ncbi:MAG: hypothetical protein O3A00_25610 [Planctomycetota bacterium]|nr:hypothetical protein [Planctomycetota bacterium]
MSVSADEPQSIRIEDRLPIGQQPVDYHGPSTHDAAAVLQARLESGKATLTHNGTEQGYLPALLKELRVPVSSQVLVFPKTALNQKLVTPKNPRAVYFNDSVSVGWVFGAHALEIAAVDPKKGPVFYLLSQDADRPPKLERQSRCLACHSGNTTNHVPGWMVRGFVTDNVGKPISGYSRITHGTDVSKRWGGWYVTGLHGKQTHCGNIYGESALEAHRSDPAVGSNTQSLNDHLPIDRYLTDTSDIVAHLVLNHQAHGINLLVRAGYEQRLNRRSDVEDRLVRYLVFADEAPLQAPITHRSEFAKHFSKGSSTAGGSPSLREFDLQTRLFKYRLSYLIDSPLFDGLPDAVRDRVYRRLWLGLTNDTKDAAFQHLPTEERAAIVRTVATIKKSRPGYWR